MKRAIVILIVLLIALFVVSEFKKFIVDHPVAQQNEQDLVTETTSSVSIGLNDTFSINGVTLRPMSITQDSRCPSDVTCIQAGKVVVAVHFGSSAFEIEQGQTKMAEGMSLTLEQVTPYPVSTRKIIDNEYKFKFLIKGK